MTTAYKRTALDPTYRNWDEQHPERVEALARFAHGEPAIVLLDELCVFVLNGNSASTAGVHHLVKFGSGLIQVATEEARLNKLAIPAMRADAGARLPNMHVAVDAATGIGTGISALDRARTIRLLADPDSGYEDFTRPGHVLPIGVHPQPATRVSAADTAFMLSALAGGRPAVSAFCEVVSTRTPTAMAQPSEGAETAKQMDLPCFRGVDVAHAYSEIES